MKDVEADYQKGSLRSNLRMAWCLDQVAEGAYQSSRLFIMKSCQGAKVSDITEHFSKPIGTSSSQSASVAWNKDGQTILISMAATL